jgi:DNA repair and recombination protein RAD54 and RAD54-like protein
LSVRNNNRELPAPLPKDYNPIKILKSKFKVPFKTDADQAQPIVPTTTRTLGVRRRLHIAARALHDWTEDGSIILYDPEKDDPKSDNSTTEEDTAKEPPMSNHLKGGKSLAALLGTKKIEHKKGHVVVDPILAKVLRPHQIEGVKFLYRCTTGKIHPDAYGYRQEIYHLTVVEYL